MSDADKGLELVDRSINQQERKLILWLIEHSSPSRPHLASQIDSLRVVSKCKCGCPTVYFAVEGDPPSRKGEAIISDFLSQADGLEVGVMLFELHERLSSLEVYSCAGNDKSFGLPNIESLCSWEEYSKRGNRLTQETLRKSANGEELHRADDAPDLFKKLGI